MYIREAHPTDGRQAQANVQEGILIKDPKTLEERQKVAQEFAAQFKVSLPILVDTIDDQVEKAYAGWPDRIYVIDAEGKVAYKGGPGPQGFRVAEVPPVLDKLLGVPSPVPAPGEVRPGRPGFPPEMRQRLTMMLTRMGLSEKETEQVMQAVDKKMEAYRDLTEARMALLRAVREQGDVEKALTALQDAQKKYAEAVEKIDKELDAALGYSQKPLLKAALTAMGLIGISPAPPFSGMPMGPMGRPGGAGR